LENSNPPATAAAVSALGQCSFHCSEGLAATLVGRERCCSLPYLFYWYLNLGPPKLVVRPGGEKDREGIGTALFPPSSPLWINWYKRVSAEDGWSFLMV